MAAQDDSTALVYLGEVLRPGVGENAIDGLRHLGPAPAVTSPHGSATSNSHHFFRADSPALCLGGK